MKKILFAFSVIALLSCEKEKIDTNEYCYQLTINVVEKYDDIRELETSTKYICDEEEKNRFIDSISYQSERKSVYVLERKVILDKED